MIADQHKVSPVSDSDKLAVAEVIQTERAARDQGQWARMAACYHPDSLVSISWIETSGPEFVAASERAFAAGLRHLHQMAPTLVTLSGDRALAETGCAILLGGRIGGVEVLVTSHARLHARVERRGDGAWRILRLGAVYFQDAMTARIPGEVPPLDPLRLAAYRPSLRFLSYLLEEGGKTPRADLAGIDRPELVEAMLGSEQAWLTTG
ncbi:MAG: nuclear transport factor 2 family protein [Caulobacter sp.]|nr:nuclear transport factor 2 family protein [Caulobacter sp.]